MSNFVIPTNREDLLTCTPGQYYVEEVLSTRLIPIKLQETKTSLLKGDGLMSGGDFEVFFSVVCRFHELDTSIRYAAWATLNKVCERYCTALPKILRSDDGENNAIWESEHRINYLNALKMNIYLLVHMMENYHAASRQKELVTPVKGKKGSKAKTAEKTLGIDWEYACPKSLQLIMSFVDLDIHRLWETQLVEDEFTSLISNLCYKILEDKLATKNKATKNAIFHLLGLLIKKHNQSLSSSLKLVQMLQHFEHIALPMAEAVELWVTTYKCKSMVAEILRELSHIQEKELVRDTVITRTISNFLMELAKVLPAELLTHISLILARMGEEPYSIRNALLCVFREILVQCLNGEGLDNKAKSDRDQFLDILYDHANLDVSAFVRCKALHVLLDLVKEQALPIKRCPKLVDLCVRLLLDKSNLVRKATVQLLEGLLRWNPFAATLPITELQDGLEEAKQKLQELQIRNGSTSSTNETPDSNEKDDENKDVNKTNEEQENIPPEKEADETSEAEEEVVEDELQEEEDSETIKQQKIITFLSDSVCFVEKFHEAVPVLCQLLRSNIQSDVLAAISFFTAAWEFKLGFAIQGIAEMLDQIWNEEQKIRDAVVYAYKEFYFKQTGASGSKPHAEQVADNMIILAAGSGRDKLDAVEALLGEMQKSNDISTPVAQVLWNRFLNPPSSFTMETGISEAKQRKVIVQLIGMLANNNPNMLKPKIDVLVEVGLQEEQSLVTTDSSKQLTDFELARHTCTTLLKLARRKLEAGKYTPQFRLPNDHNLFTTLTQLLIKGFTKDSNTWIRFAMQASGVVFQLSEFPILLSTLIFKQLQEILKVEGLKDTATSHTTNMLLTRFFSISGHFALKLLIFIDGDVQSEIKRRRRLEEEKEEQNKKDKKQQRRSKTTDKNENTLEEEMGVGGATADDADQEMIKNVLEVEIVGPDSLFGSISELLVRACMINVPEDDVSSIRVQQSASLALAKYMLVSSEFCEKHMRLFFTMLETSPHEGIRANLIICAGDLCVRFPNLMEPWTANIYARLNDSSNVVRVYGIKVLTNLILNDMIKVKGHVSEMAKCIADENEKISMLAKRFFEELSKKGNAVYNVMPDIISRLSDPEHGVKDDVDFKLIMRFLFDYIQKEKQFESLVEKLCHRFKATRNMQQWRDLAYCLSLLSYHEKAVKKLIENFSFYSDVLFDEQVYYSFDAILNKCKKSTKPELKNQIEELEGKIIDHHTQGVSDEAAAAKAAEASRKFRLPSTQSVSQPPETPTKKRKFSLIRELSVSCDRLSLDPETTPIPNRRRKVSSPLPHPVSPPDKKRRLPSNKRAVASARKNTKLRKKRRESFCSDDDVVSATVTSVAGRRSTRARTTRQKQAVTFSSDEDSDLNDDIKENIRDAPPSDDDEEVGAPEVEKVSTPIRRKKTPKRQSLVSVLRA